MDCCKIFLYVFLPNYAFSIDSFTSINKFYRFITLSSIIKDFMLLLKCLVLILYHCTRFLSLKCYKFVLHFCISYTAISLSNGVQCYFRRLWDMDTFMFFFALVTFN